MLIYVYILFLILSLSNVYLVWLIIELIFLFFFLRVLSYENKRVGLVVYYFFQRAISLLLLIVMFFSLDKLIFFILSAKLGLFPFFYWVVVVSVKVGVVGNLFVLRLQKVRLFWILWLVLNCSLRLLYLLVYGRIFFVVINLLIIRDLWLLIVYSSIANTGIILISILGSHYLILILLYLRVIFIIIYIIYKLDSYNEMVLLVFFFLVIPPFLLFMMKLYIIISLDILIKVSLFLVVFDVLVLLYYFRLVFIKFMLMEIRMLIYIMNMLILLCMLILRNCVTMIVFN